jgi:hypothetical protein
MTWHRIKDWGMCALFWSCLFLVADRFLASPACAAPKPTIIERLVESIK